MRSKRQIDYCCAAFATIAFGFAMSGSVSAQTVYDWIGPGGVSGSGDVSLWTDTSWWDDDGVGTGAPPSTTPPGSALNGGATTDVVNIANARTSGVERVRINSDVGTIDSLTIGGSTGTSTGVVSVQLSGGSGNLSVGTVTIGSSGMNTAEFLLSGNGATADVDQFVSGSSTGDKRISIREQPNGGLTINGDGSGNAIDSSGTREISFRIQADVDTNPSRFELNAAGSQLLRERSEITSSFVDWKNIVVFPQQSIS